MKLIVPSQGKNPKLPFSHHTWQHYLGPNSTTFCFVYLISMHLCCWRFVLAGAAGDDQSLSYVAHFSGPCVRGAIKWDAGSTPHGPFLVGKHASNQAIKRAFWYDTSQAEFSAACKWARHITAEPSMARVSKRASGFGFSTHHKPFCFVGKHIKPEGFDTSQAVLFCRQASK